MNKEMLPILAGLITAISTLTAVFITNYFNMKSLERNFRFQSGLKNKELRLNKLEESYELFEKWCTFFSVGYLNYLYFHSKKISESELFELLKNPENSLSGEFQKLITLLNIHFPELEVEYEKVNLARSEIVKYMNIDKKIDVQDFVKAQVKFENIAKNFKNEIAQLAKNMRMEE
ncbi:hypothetical protein DJ533_06430 [Acinetobacter defluvii]|uniref:Uncharacterized protein n=1 Tax=Acinetobacter defluvii TaxID=1871111 RepID=A0A2S2FBH1_9GAMM|nr:hypothetical protein [Acinetobacter defluvii]AWL28238.1 hypothetical protein DJ533_06430 [Acinetobacter defluvii]